MPAVENTSGLVLRTRRLTETSLIVQWLTPELGRIATVAKGALRPQSPFRGKLDLFYEADLSFVRSRRSELHTLREVKLRETHPLLRRELALLQQAAYAAALLEQTTETETPLPELFQMMHGFISALSTHPPQPQMAFAFELKLLHQLGLEPASDYGNLTPGSRVLLKTMTHHEWEMVYNLKLSPAQSTELRQFLHGFLLFHLGRIPKSRLGALLR
jgi:DNA repair protein RecO (recombination protein O)